MTHNRTLNKRNARTKNASKYNENHTIILYMYMVTINTTRQTNHIILHVHVTYCPQVEYSVKNVPSIALVWASSWWAGLYHSIKRRVNSFMLITRPDNNSFDSPSTATTFSRTLCNNMIHVIEYMYSGTSAH